MIPNSPAQIPDYLEKIKDYPDLTLEELGRNNLRFFQLEDSFKFGNEQVFLAHFASSLLTIKNMKDLENRRRDFKILDPGAGSGILTVLSSALIPNSTGLAVEIMKRPSELLDANLKINALTKRFEALNADIKDLMESASTPRDFDMAICNPPYFKLNSGPVRDMSTDGGREVGSAKEEMHISLDQYIEFVSKSLKNNGTMAMVHRPERLADVISIAIKHGLHPFRLRQVKTKEYANPKVFLLACKKSKNVSFKWDEDLIVYKEDGVYTEEVAKFYEE